ncbi:MAG: efflux RND transporter periplasmic adaptor subunit [Pirellulales bacterium]|nr:efflux RND transporter periplasmic adaptor subunit [Pirellulales bacterium]
MKVLTEKILHFLVLIVITLVAVGVMWKLSAKEQLAQKQNGTAVRPLAKVAAQKAPVAIHPLQVQKCEITNTYAGKIQPWENYQVGFAVGGRVISLGMNDSGVALDEGDRVQSGQVLAMLDDRVFRAQKSEAAARIEQATSELRRAEQIRNTRPEALTESELQRLVTDLALAKAQYEVALKNLDDTTLRSPVDATISKRIIKSGESVGANQIVFELVEINDVLLVVDVPESHIRELEERMRVVEQNRFQHSENTPPDEDAIFRAHVHLEGRDRFGNPWPTLDGEVYRIPEVSDSRTGLFPLEIRLSNAERLLRPGMVATADVVTARLLGYEVPESAILFRRRSAHLFSVTREPAQMEMLYWNVGPANVYRARRVPLSRWIDQGETIFVPADEAKLSSVVVRGQFRLADKQWVRIVNLDDFSPGEVQLSAPTQRVDVATGKERVGSGQ